MWCARWRDHDGRHEKRLAPAWQGKGTPPPGMLRRREAQAMLEELLVEARRGTRRQERTGLTFALLADEWFEHGKFERDWSAATQVDYRSVLDAHLIKAFGSKRVETITTAQIQKWRDAFAKELGPDGTPRRAPHRQQNRHPAACRLRARRRPSRSARQPRRQGQAPARVSRPRPL